MAQEGERVARLVARAAAGDRDAFARLCERYDDRLRGFFASALRRDEIDDAVQDTLMRALAALDRREPMRSFEG